MRFHRSISEELPECVDCGSTNITEGIRCVACTNRRTQLRTGITQRDLPGLDRNELEGMHLQTDTRSRLDRIVALRVHSATRKPRA